MESEKIIIDRGDAKRIVQKDDAVHNKKRSLCLDILKTIAIISVVFYHMTGGNGYLGVEIFFVVSGYLFVKSNHNKIIKGEYKPIQYIINRVLYFWPQVIVSGIVCLGLGSIFMLPDDYENLAQSVIASNFFANNILLSITSRDYWNISNMYKPLMHFWYLGVLIQCLLVISIAVWAASKVFKRNSTRKVLVFITLISFIAYIFPWLSYSEKFYWFPFRLFEITFGGLLSYVTLDQISVKAKKCVGYLGIVMLLLILTNQIDFPAEIRLIGTVLITALVIICHVSVNEQYGLSNRVTYWLTWAGRNSFEIYVWHQVIIAWLVYVCFDKLDTIPNQAVVIVLTLLMTVGTIALKYRIEKCKRKIFYAIGAVALAMSMVVSFGIYMSAGVIRDIPELGVDRDNIHRNMHAEYVDVPYSWNHDFSSENKCRVLLIGNSFARDFANVLHESKYNDQLEISYTMNDRTEEIREKADNADVVIFSVDSWNVSPWVLENVPAEKLYIVGNKMYGTSNGAIYAHRLEDDYLEQRVSLSEEFLAENQAMKEKYGDHYIDMISPLLKDGSINVFTDDGFFISQDCRHLTKQGAQYYARILDLSFCIE